MLFCKSNSRKSDALSCSDFISDESLYFVFEVRPFYSRNILLIVVVFMIFGLTLYANAVMTSCSICRTVRFMN